MKGRVSWWNRRKGFGFITSDEGEDYFVHYSDLESGVHNLKAKDGVAFEVGYTEQGKKALRVRLDVD
jgi:CspA family cold shock protein